MDRKNDETYGNKTQSALKAYNLDPVKQYHSAGQIGYENYKKLESFASLYLEEKGFTLPKLLDIATARALSTDNKAWWDELMIMTGNKKAIVPQNVTTNNTQININAAEAVNFNAKFKEFLEKE